jgi:hypothetical protein
MEVINAQPKNSLFDRRDDIENLLVFVRYIMDTYTLSNKEKLIEFESYRTILYDSGLDAFRKDIALRSLVRPKRETFILE